MNKIKIKNLQKKIKINRQSLKKLANRALKFQGIDGRELSILLVDDRAITDLNKRYLKKNSPTDVLAFRMAEGKFAYIHPEILGDVVISLETAANRAGQFSTSSEQEAGLYLVHGILHLLGFEDKTASGKRKMKKIQKEILKRNA